MRTSFLFSLLTAMSAFATAPVPKEDVRRIPLESIYGTSAQNGAKQLNSAFTTKDGINRYTEPYGADLADIRRKTHSHASNVLLVRGEDITEAVKAAHPFLAGGFGSEPKSKELWMVAYLGMTSSCPPIWLAEYAEVREKTIRLTYYMNDPDTRTHDRFHYFFWVPLGKLQPGTYILELFDAHTKEVTLLRRVRVDQK